MRKIKVTFEVELPFEATNQQILEWVRFELGISPNIPRNPLVMIDLSDPDLKIEVSNAK